MPGQRERERERRERESESKGSTCGRMLQGFQGHEVFAQFQATHPNAQAASLAALRETLIPL